MRSTLYRTHPPVIIQMISCQHTWRLEVVLLCSLFSLLGTLSWAQLNNFSHPVLQKFTNIAEWYLLYRWHWVALSKVWLLFLQLVQMCMSLNSPQDFLAHPGCPIGETWWNRSSYQSWWDRQSHICSCWCGELTSHERLTVDILFCRFFSITPFFGFVRPAWNSSSLRPMS